jgi:Holliday junction resolvase RusA-like endonuclease
MAKKVTTEEDLKAMGLSQQNDGSWSRNPTRRQLADLLTKSACGPIIYQAPYPNTTWEDDSTEVKLEVSKPLAIFTIDPIGAPRMTRSDQWKTDPFHKDPKKRQRKPVTQYFKFRDSITRQAKEQGFTLPDSGFHMVFILAVPHSWSEKKKNKMIGAPHQQRPDCDNLCKCVFDSLLTEDAHIWDCRITKKWGLTGKIIIYKMP